jgi:hypothetical protein
MQDVGNNLATNIPLSMPISAETDINNEHVRKTRQDGITNPSSSYAAEARFQSWYFWEKASEKYESRLRASTHEDEAAEE